MNDIKENTDRINTLIKAIVSIRSTSYPEKFNQDKADVLLALKKLLYKRVDEL